MTKRHATFIFGPSEPPPITLAVECGPDGWRMVGAQGDLWDRAAIVVLDDGEILKNEHGPTASQVAARDAVDGLSRAVRQEAIADRIIAAVEDFSGLMHGPALTLNATTSADAVSKAIHENIDIVTSSRIGVVEPVTALDNSPADHADVERGPDDSDEVAGRGGGAMGFPDREGFWWVKLGRTAAWMPVLVQESDALGGFAVFDRGQCSALADFDCYAWGPRATSPDERMADRPSLYGRDLGNEVEFTFKGETTVVAKDAGSVSSYLRTLDPDDGFTARTEAGARGAIESAFEAEAVRLSTASRVLVAAAERHVGLSQTYIAEDKRPWQDLVEACALELAKPFPAGSFEAEHVKAMVERDRLGAEMMESVTRTLEHQRLRDLAEAATPGPWEWDEAHNWLMHIEDHETGSVVADVNDVDPPNARYIAAADPRTVLALIDAAEHQAGVTREDWARICKVAGVPAGSKAERVVEAIGYMVSDKLAASSPFEEAVLACAVELVDATRAEGKDGSIASAGGARLEVLHADSDHPGCVFVTVARKHDPEDDERVALVSLSELRRLIGGIVTGAEWHRICAAAGVPGDATVDRAIQAIGARTRMDPGLCEEIVTASANIAADMSETSDVRAAALNTIAALAEAISRGTPFEAKTVEQAMAIATQGEVGAETGLWRSGTLDGAHGERLEVMHVDDDDAEYPGCVFITVAREEDTEDDERVAIVPLEDLRRLLGAQRGGIALGKSATVGPTERACIGPADGAEFLKATPAGACRRYTERHGADEVTLEADHRPVGQDIDPDVVERAAAMVKLQGGVEKMLAGNFGAGRFEIGGLDVFIADERHAKMVDGQLRVSVSTEPREA